MMKSNIQEQLVFVNKGRLFDFTSKPCETMRMKTLGQRVKELREKKGLKQTELAELIGISQQAIQQIEASPSGRTKYLAKLAQALDVSQAYLLGEATGASARTKQNDIAYRQFIPILEENDILPWVEHGALPKSFRSVDMSEFPTDPSINEKTYLKDITHDAFVGEFFKIRLPNKSLLAIIDYKALPVAYDIVMVQLADKKIKIRQYMKDGNEYFLRSFDTPAEKNSLEGVKILGVISGYLHKNLDKN